MKNTRILVSTLILAALAATGYALAGSTQAPAAAEACCSDSACCAAGAACCSK